MRFRDSSTFCLPSSIVLASVLLFAGCMDEDDAPDGVNESSALLSAQISGVTFRTNIAQTFIGAANNGGGAVTATATVAEAWETFTILDVNGGALESGDSVYVRTGNGRYLTATNGGGTTLDATAQAPRAFETFRIVRAAGAGPVLTGDVIGLRALVGGQFVSAAGGGGGAVFAYGAALGPWEQLTVSLGASTAAATRISGVTLRTTLQPRYLSAVGNGGAGVTATASTANAWETFSILDDNGGTLESGDEVRIITGNGRFFQAANGGGTTLNAASTHGLAWETSRIVSATPGTITTGSVVGLQTITTGSFVSALNGGGSDVRAFGAALGDWERFTITLGETRWVYGHEASGWRLVWSDEFEGAQIDESKWAYEVWPPRRVNNELQSYTYRRSENARIENGALVIEARRDFFEGNEYSSARLKTQGKASFTYGRIEARIQVPGGWGTWPAFWMMPDDQHRGWPACGEIDIMEEVGYDQDRVHATTHTQAYNWRSPNQRTSSTVVAGLTTGYHVYAAEWSPDGIEFSVDGMRYFTSPNDNTGDDAWPFDKDFHVILNLAVGGDWGGAQGVDPNIWPRRMRVDYVRVYQR
jgi:uncharacterized Zn ribbon protein